MGPDRVSILNWCAIRGAESSLQKVAEAKARSLAAERGTDVIVIGNDDGKKMTERDSLDSFLEEYAHVTGVKLTLTSAGERPDFVCERRGRSYGLEVVRAMRNPLECSWDSILGRDDHLDGLDASILVQDVLYDKEHKRASPGRRFQKSTILVIQLIGGDGEEMVQYLDSQVMNEMAQTGFREIWVSDHSPIEAYGTVQLVGVKPKRLRGIHRHRFYGFKPYG
jgi:hypothetical protein